MHALNLFKHLLAGFALLLRGGRFAFIPGIVFPTPDKHHRSDQRNH